MADTFKMTSYDVTTSYATAYTAGGTTTTVIIGLQVANMHASAASWLSIKVVQSGAGSESILAHQINIPINDSLAPIHGKLVLETGDYIQMQAENASSLEATISYLEQT